MNVAINTILRENGVRSLHLSNLILRQCRGGGALVVMTALNYKGTDLIIIRSIIRDNLKMNQDFK